MILVNVLLVALLFFHPNATAAHRITPRKRLLAGDYPADAHYPEPQPLLQDGPQRPHRPGTNRRLRRRDQGRRALHLALRLDRRPDHRAHLHSRHRRILTYIPADKVDLTGPVPQILAAAFAPPPGAPATTGINWGLMLGRGAILALALSVIAQYASSPPKPRACPWSPAGTASCRNGSRASVPASEPRALHLVIVGIAVIACTLASYNTSAQEAFQLLTVTAAFIYDIYFAMMFLIPLTVGKRFGKPASLGLKSPPQRPRRHPAARLLQPLPHHRRAQPHPLAEKIISASVVINIVGLALYFSPILAERIQAL